MSIPCLEMAFSGQGSFIACRSRGAAVVRLLRRGHQLNASMEASAGKWRYRQRTTALERLTEVRLWPIAAMRRCLLPTRSGRCHQRKAASYFGAKAPHLVAIDRELHHMFDCRANGGSCLPVSISSVPPPFCPGRERLVASLLSHGRGPGKVAPLVDWPEARPNGRHSSDETTRSP